MFYGECRNYFRVYHDAGSKVVQLGTEIIILYYGLLENRICCDL